MQEVKQGADLALIGKEHRLTLLSSGGDVIASVEDGKPQLILQAVDQQRWLQRFTNAAVSRPSGLALEFDDEQLGATRVAGDKLGFRLVSERPAYLVLLAIDPEGTARLLYPAFADEIVLSPAHDVLRLRGIDVVSPFGLDSVVAFALPKKPDWLEPYIGRDIAAGSREWQQLAAQVQHDSDAAATAIAQAITAASK